MAPSQDCPPRSLASSSSSAPPADDALASTANPGPSAHRMPATSIVNCPARTRSSGAPAASKLDRVLTAELLARQIRSAWNGHPARATSDQCVPHAAARSAASAEKIDWRPRHAMWMCSWSWPARPPIEFRRQAHG